MSPRTRRRHDLLGLPDRRLASCARRPLHGLGLGLAHGLRIASQRGRQVLAFGRVGVKRWLLP